MSATKTHDAESKPASGTKKPAKGRRTSIFMILTIIAGAIAISLIVWRIGKAWRIEYGGGPREPPPIPTGGAFGAPGGQ